jgi:hypothetical protein
LFKKLLGYKKQKNREIIMLNNLKAKGAVAAVFVQFAEVPEGVQIVASSDPSLRRLKVTTFPDYNEGCLAMEDRLSHRANPPSSLVCELKH